MIYSKNIIISVVLIFITLLILVLFKININTIDNRSISAKEFNTIYNIVDYNEMKILDNTIISFPDYVNSYGIIQYSFEQKIYEILRKKELTENDKIELSQYFYLIRNDVHDLKLLQYDELV
jgi:hypothetical protein